MTTDALKVYYGGFMGGSLSPLGLDFGYCGRCVYCFSDLSGQPKANFKQAMSLLATYRKRETLAADLLQQGYPVMISGTSDPFTPQHAKTSLPMLEVLSELGIRVEFATKGGDAAYEALEMLPWKVHWYFSIAMLDDTIRERVEPYAPSIRERLKLIEAIVAKGHLVTVGISPIISDWIAKDAKELVGELSAIGIHGCRVQTMHLSPKHKKNIPAKWLDRINPEELKKASQGWRYPEQQETHDLVKNLVLESGLHFIDSQIKERSSYYDAIGDLYPKHFPASQQFVNWCHDNKNPGDMVTWQEYKDFFVPKLPTGKYPVHDYIYARSVASSNGVIFPRHKTTFANLLKDIWRNPQVTLSPCNSECFALAGLPDGDGFKLVVDDANMPILIFLPEGCEYAIAPCQFVA